MTSFASAQGETGGLFEGRGGARAACLRVAIQRSSDSKSFKAQVFQECLQAGATIFSVAISHGIKANVIRKWLPLYRDQPPATLPAFVPVKIAPKR
ncbi:transposase [Pseudomonas kulmbachensis]|jgi:transposase